MQAQVLLGHHVTSFWPCLEMMQWVISMALVTVLHWQVGCASLSIGADVVSVLEDKF